MEKTKILVVDDHAIMRDGIRALLEHYEDLVIVGEAADGKEALDKIFELKPDLVIMDVTMPRMDGLEVIRRVKSKLPGLKIIVLTQHDNREYILSIIKTGAFGYVPKRAVSSDLITAIRAAQKGEHYLYPSAVSALINSYLEDSDTEDPYDALTGREREILKLIAEGHSSREIAALLSINIHTVFGHRNKLIQKLNLHSRTELVRYAMRKGLISSEL